MPTISLDETAYDLLEERRREGERFSDVVKRLATSPTSPFDSAGAYPDLGTAVEAAQEEFEGSIDP